MNPKYILEKLLDRQNLSRIEMQNVMLKIIAQQYDEAWIGAFLTALRAKGECVEELLGACDVLHQQSQMVHLNSGAINKCIVDVVGTGGDHQQSFNISTAAMLVAASAGACVAKHGGRSVSSTSGSADCLEALGVELPSIEKVSQHIQSLGVGFMFAPNHHPAMRVVSSIRKSLGVRTIFNLLGPLLNPAQAKCILLGVYDEAWIHPITKTLAEQGYQHAWVVCANGLDELSSITPTQVGEVKNGTIKYFTITPQDHGFRQDFKFEDIRVDSAQSSAKLILDIFEGRNKELAYDMVVLNAAAVLYIAGEVVNLAQGISQAKAVIDKGLTSELLEKLRTF